MTPILTERQLREIGEHARAAWPGEACGFIVVRDETDHVHRARNVMDELHARRPRTYPRPATHAYAIAPEDMVRLGAYLRDGYRLHAIYHSHTHREGANFSADDVAWALHGRRSPTYPEAAQVVMSLDADGPTSVNGYRWDNERGEFVLTGCAVYDRTGSWVQPRVLPLVELASAPAENH